MKTTLKLEELGMFLIGIYAFNLLEFAWWWFPVLLFLPDVGMLGYFMGNRAGAFIYNLFHHKGLAVLIFFSGIYSGVEVMQLAGIILFSHASFDRILGYGLKYNEGFRLTHLGKIGKKKKNVYGYRKA